MSRTKTAASAAQVQFILGLLGGSFKNTGGYLEKDPRLMTAEEASNAIDMLLDLKRQGKLNVDGTAVAAPSVVASSPSGGKREVPLTSEGEVDLSKIPCQFSLAFIVKLRDALKERKVMPTLKVLNDLIDKKNKEYGIL